MTSDAIMIFAAGLGTRMGSLTKSRPKPLIEVAGRPLIDHALDIAEGLGTIVVNVHYRAEQIKQHLSGTDIRISEEHDQLLDTGGGLKHALPLLDADPVFTLNSDAVWKGPAPLDLLRSHWDADRMDALLLVVPLDRAIGRLGGGDFSLPPSGQLLRGSETVYTGAQLIRTTPVDAHPEDVFSLNEVWNDMAKAGRLHGVEYPGFWCDVGRPEGIALAEDLLRGLSNV